MKVQLVKAVMIALMPTNGVRCMLYRAWLGYQVDRSARIGFATLIAVNSCRIGAETQIGPFNIFKGAMAMSIGARTRIGRLNEFTANWKLQDPRYAHMGYTPILEIGDGCLVLHQHYFDVYGRMVLGNGSWIAGVRSQFWTHGVSVMDRDIVIGRNNYIGSSVRFVPGSSIGDGNVVGMGSVISSRIDADDSIISGFPAKAIKCIADAKDDGRYRFSFEDWAG